MGKSKRTPPPAVEADKFLSIEDQVSQVKFRPPKGGNKTNDPNTKALQLSLSFGSVQGLYPIVAIRNARLGPIGKRDESRRGLCVFKNKDSNYTFPRLALWLDSKQHGDLRQLLAGILKRWKDDHDPNKSMWYQNNFEDLTDGSKVFTAARGMEDMSAYDGVEFTGDDEFDSPDRTYGKFFTAEDESPGQWLCSFFLDQGYDGRDGTDPSDFRIFFTTEKAMMPDKEENENIVYKKDGIPIKNHSMINNLVDSDFYRKGNWGCNAMIQVTGLTWRCAKTTSGDPCLYPIFRMRVTDSIRFKPLEDDAGGNGLTREQRSAIMSSIIFEGLSGPAGAKKRKKSAVAPTFNVPKKAKADSPVPESQEIDEIADTDGEA